MTMTDAEWCTQSEGFRRASIDTQHAFEFALTATGGITGWQQRLTCRAATQASIERTFGPNWRELRAQCERQTRGPLNTRSDSDCIGREVLEYIGRVVSVDPLDGLLVNSTGDDSDEWAWGMGCVCTGDIYHILCMLTQPHPLL